MKGLNLKKVAAVTAGVALVAASVTAAVNWSDLVNTADHTMKVNGMVVGDSAAVEDSQAAVLLAGKLAEKAVYDVTTTSTKDVETCVPGSAFEGKTKKYDTAALAAPTSGVLTYTQLGTDVLTYESTLSYKVGGATYDAYAKETLGFATTPAFDTSSKVQRLNAEFSANDLNYDVTFGATNAGVDFNADGGWTSGSTWADAGAADKVEIPFLGKTYVVHKVILNSDSSAISQLELFEKNAIKTYKKGDKVDGLNGKDGKAYYVTINGITVDSTQVSLSLYDASTGVAVEDYKDELVSETDKFAEDILESVLEITDIYNLGTSDVPDHSVEMAVGAEAVTVYTAKGFPYDSTKTSTSEYDWIATITSSMENNEVDLTAITLKNGSQYRFTNDDGLATGDMVEFPGGLAALKFVGLQLPEFTGVTNAKEVHTFEFGVDVAEGNGIGIKYVDSAETTHEVPFYYELTLDIADSADAVTGADYKVDSFEFDGKTYSMKIVYESDNNMDVYVFEGAYAATAAAGSALDSVADYNESVNKGISVSQLGLNNSEEDAIQYSFFTADVTNDTVWLLLGAQEIADTWDDGSDITVVGTDVNGEAADFTTIDGNAYLPADNGDFETAYNALGTAGSEFDDSYASIFKMTVDLAGTSEISMVLDTETGRALAYGASSNASNAIPGPGSQLDDDYDSADLQLKKGATNGLEEFYDTYGVKASIDSDDVISLVIPDAVANVELQVIGKGGTAAETCTTASQEVTETVPTVFTGLPFTPIKASEASATGKYVVVGGYMVNALFPAQAEVATVLGAPLAAEGDKVAGVANGNVYIAGYTKEDTQAAVNEVIALLDSTPM